MGYNYKTTDPQNIDFAYQLPTNLMVQALQVADAANDQQIAQTDILGNANAKVNYLPNDADRVAAKQAEYNQRISDLTSTITADPANYRKRMPDLRALTRSLSDDMSNGEYAAIMGNANKLAQWDKDNHQKVLDGKVSEDAYKASRANFLSSFSTSGGTNFDPNKKTYNTLSTEDLYETPDINKLISTATEKIKADSSDHKTEGGKDLWLVSNGSKKEWVGRDRVAQIALDSITSDPKVTGYLKQGTRLGYLNGAYDKDGSFIQPYAKDTHGNLVWNPNSMLAAPIRAAVGRDAYTKTETEQSMKANPYAEKQVQFDNDVKLLKIRQDSELQGDAIKEAMKQKYARESAIFKARLAGTPEAAIANAIGGGASKTAFTASPDGITTVSPFAGAKEITSKGADFLAADSKAEVIRLQGLVQDPKLSENERALLQDKLINAQAQAETYGSLQQQANDYAVSHLKGYSRKDVQAYNDFVSNAGPLGRNSITGTISDIDKELDKITIHNYTGGQNRQPYTDSEKARQLLDTRKIYQDRLDKVNTIYDKMSKTKDEWYKTNSYKQNIKVNGVGLSADNKKVLLEGLKFNADNLDIRDLNTDNAQHSDDAKDAQTIVQKALKSGEDLSKILDIKTINPPIPGVGVTATVTLKGQTHWYGNGKDKDVIVPIPTSLAHSIGSNMQSAGSSQKEIATGKLINDQAKSNFLLSINSTFIDTMSDGTKQPVSTVVVDSPLDKQKHIIKIIPVADPDPNHRDAAMLYQVQVKDANGKYVTYPKEFANTQSIADEFFGN